MLKNKFYRTLLVGGITGSLIISTSLIAFASSSNSTATPKTKIGVKSFGGPRGESNDYMQKRGNPLLSVLNSQVTAGVITQEESDQVIAFLKTKKDARTATITARKATRDAEKDKLKAMTPEDRQTYIKANRPAKENIFADVVTAGILTQDQVDKILASMPQRPESGKDHGGLLGRSEQGMHKSNLLVDMLNSQVTTGVITQTESDQVIAFLKTKEDARTAAITARKATRDAEKDKLKAMTPEDRQTYMKANRPTKENIFADVVTAGILTQDQVDKILASMPQRPEKGNWNGQKPAGSPINNGTATKL